LPQIVQEAYTLLGADWLETLKLWQESGHTSPPVMLTVCNKTETAARVEHYFRNGNAFWLELHEPNKTLRVDSKVLEKAELGETASSDKAYESVLQGILEAAQIPETRKADLRNLKKEELPAITVAAQMSLATRPTQSLYQIGYLKGSAEISCANAGTTCSKKKLTLLTAMFSKKHSSC
jgi:hypothetical protein